jgi:hypothetical protein
MTMPFESERLSRLFALVLKALAWDRWQALIDEKAGVWSGILNVAGESFSTRIWRWTPEHWLRRNLGADPFSSVGVQRRDDAQMSVWVFTIYGELRLYGHPEALHERLARHIISRPFLDGPQHGGRPITHYGGPNTVEHNAGLSRDLSSPTVRLRSRICKAKSCFPSERPETGVRHPLPMSPVRTG